MNKDSYFDSLQVVKIPNPDPTSIKLIRLPDTLQEVTVTSYENGKIVLEEIVKVAKINIEYSE